jgi:hypothetical protein
MPTVPLKATPPANAPRELYIQRAFGMLANTAPFDATGHPAMSIPCGMSEGLPVGLMLIGNHYDESQSTGPRQLSKKPVTGRRCEAGHRNSALILTAKKSLPSSSESPRLGGPLSRGV